MNMNKLCLGTVQFGLHYGINNKTGKPAQEQVFAMLDKAISTRIEYFDTAAAYGDAELLLGQFIESRCLQGGIKVVSKLMPNLIDEKCSNNQAEETVVEEIHKSLRKLHIETLEGYLLHTPTNFYNNGVMQGLKKVKQLGLVKNIGVSIYETEHALDVVSSGIVDYIQIPFNVFDQRLTKTDFFNIAGKNGVTVFARSPFLQGLLFITEEEVPDYLGRAREYLRDFEEIIRHYNLTRAEAAFCLSYLNPGIDYVVFGVDNLEQLAEDIEVVNKITDAHYNCTDQLKEHFKEIEKEIIFPSLWANK